MARREPSANGHNRLEEAIAILIQNQAAFVSQQQALAGEVAESNRRRDQLDRESAARFIRIEHDMATIIRAISEHNQILERLTNAVREKIGFKG